MSDVLSSSTERAERCPVRHFDGGSTKHVDADPFATLADFREVEPFWTSDDPTESDGYWVVTRFDQVREVQQDYTTFSHANVDPRYAANPLMPTMFDPPDQVKQRGIVLPLLTPAAIAPLEPRMHAVCRELISSFVARGGCDVVAEFSRRYPIAIFGELYGLPEDRREEFRQLAEMFLHEEGRQHEAWTQIIAIMRDEIEQRRTTPRDDMLNGISHGRIDGDLISIDEAVNLASTVFIGGLDTLPSNIGWTLRYLADHPEQRRLLVEQPQLIPGAVEEFFRVFPVVVRNAMVHATRDVEFHGANIRKGDGVFTFLALANLDSAAFDDPLRIDFARPRNRHVAFSIGSHRCLGSHLARHELAVALEEWLTAIPDFWIADQGRVVYHGGPVFSLGALPLEWPSSSS